VNTSPFGTNTFGAAGATTVSVLATTGASAVLSNSWCKVFDIAFTILPFSPVPLIQLDSFITCNFLC
jgi:hypothetical protein